MENSLAFNYAHVVADSDPTLAMQWVMRIPEGKLRTRGLREIGKKWQAKDPAAASALPGSMIYPNRADRGNDISISLDFGWRVSDRSCG